MLFLDAFTLLHYFKQENLSCSELWCDDLEVILSLQNYLHSSSLEFKLRAQGRNLEAERKATFPFMDFFVSFNLVLLYPSVGFDLEVNRKPVRCACIVTLTYFCSLI